VAEAAPRGSPRHGGPHGPEHETREGVKQPVDIEPRKTWDGHGGDGLLKVLAGQRWVDKW
jgi:hypothetical protein